MTPENETTHGLPAVTRTVEGTVDAGTRLVATLDLAVLAAVTLAALAVGYVAVLVPAELLALLAGLVAAVALATALPFAVVWTVGATLARPE